MNTLSPCPSCSANIDPATTAQCPQCGFQMARGLVPAILQPVRKVQKIPASVLAAIYVDITGSTLKFAEGVTRTVKMALEPIEKRVQQAKICFWTGGDLDCDQECTLIANGVSVSEAIAEAARLQYSGGKDDDETPLDSFQTVFIATPWEPDRRRWHNCFIALVNANAKPSRSGMTACQLGEMFRSLGIYVYLVAEDFPFARDFVQAAAGWFFPISNDPQPAHMQQIAAKISESILMTASNPATRPMTVPMPSGTTN